MLGGKFSPFFFLFMLFLVDFNFYLCYNTIMIDTRNYYSMYHKDIYLPTELIQVVVENQKLLPTGRYSWHLENYFSCADEKHNITKLRFARVLKRIIANPIIPFEVTTVNGGVHKYVIRTSYNDDKDVSIVIICKNMWLDGTPFIKTAWLNNKDDCHATLDKRKYSREN